MWVDGSWEKSFLWGHLLFANVRLIFRQGVELPQCVERQKTQDKPSPFLTAKRTSCEFPGATHLSFHMVAVKHSYATFQPAYLWQPRQPPTPPWEAAWRQEKSLDFGFLLGLCRLPPLGPVAVLLCSTELPSLHP